MRGVRLRWGRTHYRNDVIVTGGVTAMYTAADVPRARLKTLNPIRIKALRSLGRGWVGYVAGHRRETWVVGAGAVDWRMTNSVPRVYSAPLCRLSFSILSNAWNDVAPSCSRGTRIVVNGGRARKANEMSSIPRTDMSRGTSIPAASSASIAPIAIRSFPQKITVGRLLAERMTCTAEAPASS